MSAALAVVVCCGAGVVYAAVRCCQRPASMPRTSLIHAAALLAPALSLLLAAASPGCSSSSDGPSGEPAAPATAPKVSTAPCAEPPFVGSPLGVRCGKLVDDKGRVVALRGVNARVEGIFDVTFADGRVALEPIPAFGADDARDMRAFGFDSMRLPINWSGIEPTETGGFDEAYLDRVQAAVDAAASAGLLVLLDLHQDAYSKEFGEDGAPLWAISPAPKPEEILGGPLEDLSARRLSAPVTKAFSTFFGESSEGERLRGRFVAMARHVAERFAAHPAVLGVEIFNEPVFVGNAQLLRLYAPAYEAIRQAMPGKLVLFEPSAERNFFDSAPEGSGPIGAGTAYAPHIYKLAFDGSTSADPLRMTMTKETLRPQNERAVDEAASWGAALVVTEWGYAPTGVRAEEYYTWQAELSEEYQFSTFFWVWKEASQGAWGCFDHDAATGAFAPRARVQQLLARVRPARVAGWPEQYAFDRASGVFSLAFRDDPTAAGPTEISVAPALGAPLEITCDGQGVTGVVPDGNGTLALACGAGDGGRHVIGVRVAPLP
jgi:endoglycosylceramidase